MNIYGSRRDRAEVAKDLFFNYIIDYGCNMSIRGALQDIMDSGVLDWGKVYSILIDHFPEADPQVTSATISLNQVGERLAKLPIIGDYYDDLREVISAWDDYLAEQSKYDKSLHPDKYYDFYSVDGYLSNFFYLHESLFEDVRDCEDFATDCARAIFKDAWMG